MGAERLPLILASSSPRRQELLTRAGVAFEVRPPDVSEAELPGETPAALTTRLAFCKANAVASGVGASPARVILAADTIVALGDEVLGKPDDVEHAVAMLGRLVGRSHRVLTALAVVDSAHLQARFRLVESRVSMRPASTRELREYAATGEPLDKAGAYAVQGEGRRFVTAIEGSETNVIGLPVEETLRLLREAGVAVGP